MTPDPDHMRRWIQNVYGELSPTNVAEVRVLDCRKQKTKATGWNKGDKRMGWFSNEDALIAACMDADALEGTTYATLNPVSPDLLARINNQLGVTKVASNDTDVVTRRWLLVDVDHGGKPKGVPATDAEREECLALARRIVTVQRVSGWPDPMVVDSGNGVHLLWRVDLPADDGGLIQRVLAGLDDTFSNERVNVDTTNYNPSRICKLGGAVARKGTGAVEVGRVWRTASILADGDPEVLTLHQLEGVAAHAPAVAAPKGKPKQAGTADCSSLSDKVAETLAALIAKLDYWGVTYDKPYPKGHGAQVNAKCPRPANDRDPACTGDGSDSAFLVGPNGWTYKCLHDGCGRAGFDWHAMKALFTHGVSPEPGPEVQVEPRHHPMPEEEPLEGIADSLPPYPLDVWPEWWRRYVVEASAVGQTDPAIAAAALTALLAAALGPDFRIRIASHEDAAILWLAVVGSSGVTRKSTGMDPILKIGDKIHEGMHAAWEAQVKAWKELPKEDKADADQPRLRVFVSSDTTIEGVVDQFQIDPDTGLLLAVDELSSFFGSMNAYRNKKTSGPDQAFWLKAYGGGSHTSTRASTRTRYAKRMHVSMVGGIQPRILGDLGMEREDGMFSRLLWTWVRQAGDSEEDHYFYNGEQLLRDTRSARELGFTSDATAQASRDFKQWRRVNTAQARASEGKGMGLTSQVWSRSAGMAVRLACVLHGAAVIAAQHSGAERPLVDVGLVEKATRLADYYREHALFTVTEVLIPKSSSEAKAVTTGPDLSMIPPNVWWSAADLVGPLDWTRGATSLGIYLGQAVRAGKLDRHCPHGGTNNYMRGE